MTGEDADLEKTGRIQNRVIKWGGDGITIVADQRHVREILKDLELEQANPAATPCNVDKKNENTAGSDGSKGGTHLNKGSNRSTTTGTMRVMVPRTKIPMTNDERDDTNYSQTLTGSETTKYTALVARISCLSQDRPDLKFASLQECCAMASPSRSDLERVKRIGRYLVGTPRAERLFRCNKLVSSKRTSTQTGEATRPPDDRCQLE